YPAQVLIEGGPRIEGHHLPGAGDEGAVGVRRLLDHAGRAAAPHLAEETPPSRRRHLCGKPARARAQAQFLQGGRRVICLGAGGERSDPGRLTRRSEERRVGKECKARWETETRKTKL